MAEAVCANTVCLHWSERFEPRHVDQIGQAILKVLGAYAAV